MRSPLRTVRSAVVSAGCAAALLLVALGADSARDALSLNGTNTYVTFGNASSLGLSTFTLETWLRRDGPGVAVSTGSGGIATFLPLVSKGDAEADASNVDANYMLGINTAGNVLAADFEEGAGGATPGLNHPISGVTPIVDGIWYHAAVSYDGTTWRLYLNGVLEAQVVVGQPVRSDSIQHAGLGTNIDSLGVPAGFFQGALDEARIWNVARSATQIRADLNSQLTSGTGLVARWGFEDGPGVTVVDSVGSANGTIVGAGASFVAGAPFDLAACENLDNAMLRFDGTDDYVTFGDAAELKLATFTVEAWFNRTAAGTGSSTGTGGVTVVPLIAKGAAQAENSNVDANFVFGINTTGNVLAADFEEGAGGTSPGLNHPISGTTPIANNTWYHAAATYDGSSWRLYLNGALEATLVVNQPVRSDSIQHAGIGTMLRSTGVAQGFFAGMIDEVRVWSVARTQAEIQASYRTELTSGPGLVARWGLGEGSGSTTADSVGPALSTGTLTGGPTWLTSNALFSAMAACNDALFCNGADQCNATTLRCEVHVGDPCAGGSECGDVCNEATDVCADPIGTPCAADGNACTDDVCNGAGACGVNNTASCDDGQFCTGADVCSGGSCVSAGNPCSGGGECADFCDEAGNQCADPLGTTCTPDANGCTDDVCNGAGACGVNNTAPCDDGQFCTALDTCNGGACVGAGDPCVGGGECGTPATGPAISVRTRSERRARRTATCAPTTSATARGCAGIRSRRAATTATPAPFRTPAASGSAIPAP
ncbi:MAG: LamG domain-containing protein [Deltaproteobacteria bacterium]|nr:LamG domain-containing protein [Deltaproteobacteria bacterium]